MTRLPQAALVCALASASALNAQAQDAPRCEARSGAHPPAVVELYTSEGCSSCPPADRWLSALRPGSEVVALSFHVNYWNHLGWKDPFATAETTARQYQWRERFAARHVYTPQVILNGRDQRDWHRMRADALPRLPAVAGTPPLHLWRQGQDVVARVGAASQGTHRLGGYWAVLQDDVVSRVTRGENAGSELRHDHVVGLYRPVSPWLAQGEHTERLRLPLGTPHRVAFVVTDASNLQPLQALVLACPA